MHVITAIKTDTKHLGGVLDSLKRLHMHIEKVNQSSKGVEIIAEAQTENPDVLIYRKLYCIEGVRKIFAKVLEKNKHLYA